MDPCIWALFFDRGIHARTRRRQSTVCRYMGWGDLLHAPEFLPFGYIQSIHICVYFIKSCAILVRRTVQNIHAWRPILPPSRLTSHPATTHRPHFTTLTGLLLHASTPGNIRKGVDRNEWQRILASSPISRPSPTATCSLSLYRTEQFTRSSGDNLPIFH